MRMRVITVAVLMMGGIGGCGDDNVRGNGDAGHDAGADGQTIDAPAAGACNPVTQDCMSGMRCTLNHNVPTNTTFCETGLGQQTEFMSCDPNQSSDNCAIGTVCLGVN